MYVVDAQIKQWSSRVISYNQGWYVDESILKEPATADTKIDVIYGPYTYCKKGTYAVTIEYECTDNQSCIINSNRNNDFIVTNETILNSHQNIVSFDFSLKKDVDNLEVVVRYNGKGSLLIKDISITQNHDSFLQLELFLLLFFACVDFIFIFRKKLLENKKTVFWLAVIIFFSSLPLLIKGIDDGHDYMFHLMRIEAIMEGIKQGEFPVKLASIWCDNYGYPTSVFYGDILLYFPAMLRMIGISVTFSYKCYLVFINILTVLISFYSFKGIFKKKNVALICSAAYTLATYRMVDIYVRASVGEYSAMAFLPLIAFAITKIYEDDIRDTRKYYQNSLLLMCGLTGLINTHVLTFEITCLVLLIISIFLFRKTFRRNTVIVYLKAVVETVLVNVFFLVPFLDYYKNVPVRIFTEVSSDSIKTIQQSGTYLSQYFSFFQDIFGKNRVNVNERLSLTPGMLLIITMLIGIYLFIFYSKRISKKSKAYLGISVLLLFVASNLFPWNSLAQIPFLGKILTVIQFPWRYISLACLFLVLLLGQLLEEMNFDDIKLKTCQMGIFIIIFIQVTAFVSNYNNNLSVVYYVNGSELNHFAMVKEYMRSGTNTSLFSYEIREVAAEAEIREEQGNYLKLYCTTHDEPGELEIPKLNYKGYVAKDEKGNEFEITDGENNVIKISIPANYNGNVTVDFIEPWYWRVSELISILSMIYIILSEIIKKKRMLHIPLRHNLDESYKKGSRL